MFCIHCFQWQQYNQTIEIVKPWEGLFQYGEIVNEEFQDNVRVCVLFHLVYNPNYKWINKFHLMASPKCTIHFMNQFRWWLINYIQQSVILSGVLCTLYHICVMYETWECYPFGIWNKKKKKHDEHPTKYPGWRLIDAECCKLKQSIKIQ